MDSTSDDLSHSGLEVVNKKDENHHHHHYYHHHHHHHHLHHLHNHCKQKYQPHLAVFGGEKASRPKVNQLYGKCCWL